MSTDILNISDETFEEEVLKADLPVLVDFWAVWCAPCRMIAPALDNLAQAYKDKMKVIKLDIDKNKKTASRYGIKGIPTLLLFKGGELKETIVGALPQNKIENILLKYL